MGVKICSRKGCDNIMCDTYVAGIGYVCTECQEEFKLYLIANALDAGTEVQIEWALSNYLETPKGYFKQKAGEISLDDFFKKHTV